jgi:hypothetical protein
VADEAAAAPAVAPAEAAPAADLFPATTAAPAAAPAVAPAVVEPPAVPASAPTEVQPVVPEVPLVADPPASDTPAELAAPAEPPPPTTYEPFTFPESFQVAKDDPALAKFTELAGLNHLPQEAAQGMLDLYREAGEQLQHSLVQRQFDVFADTVKAWGEESKKAFGNRYEATIADAKWGMARLGGTPAQQAQLHKALLDSGLGNHPAIIRAFANAVALREASPPPARLGQGTMRPNAADRRYANSGMGANGAQR